MRPQKRKGTGGSESVPAVVHWLPKGRANDEAVDTFALDLDLLEGLVGFEYRLIPEVTEGGRISTSVCKAFMEAALPAHDTIRGHSTISLLRHR